MVLSGKTILPVSFHSECVCKLFRDHVGLVCEMRYGFDCKARFYTSKSASHHLGKMALVVFRASKHLVLLSQGFPFPYEKLDSATWRTMLD